MTLANDKYKTAESTHRGTHVDGLFPLTTIGYVVDVNDPDQQGRVKAICPRLGDTESKKLEDLPWIIPISPLAGATGGGARTYGMHNVPHEGAEVLVMCLEGDPNHRIYLGEKFQKYSQNMLPHGRYHGEYGPYDNQNEPIQPGFDNNRDQWKKPGSRLAGCIETDESQPGFEGPPAPIPTTKQISRNKTAKTVYVNASASNIIESILSQAVNVLGKLGALGTQMATLDTKVLETVDVAEKAVERMSRGIDATASAWTESMVANGALSKYPSPKADDAGEGNFFSVSQVDGSEFTKLGVGYGPNIRDTKVSKPDSTKIKYASHTYSWTSPMFHSMSMDDKVWNSRMRFRSAAGHSIILDDSNERVYINAAKGNTWIQLDQAGMIDIYGARDISIASDKNINMSAKETIRIAAEQGVHILSEEEMRIHAKTNLHVVSNASTFMRSDSEFDISATGSFHATADGVLALKGKSGGYFQAGCALHFKTDGPAYLTSSEAHINSTPANDAPEAVDAFEAFTPTRIPEHEPWARTYSNPDIADGEGKKKKKPSFGSDGPTAVSVNDGTSTEEEGQENSFASKDKYTDPCIDTKDRYDAPYDGSEHPCGGRGKYWHR